MRVRTLVFTVVTIMALGAPIAALDTAFSYQGRLNDAGSPADGDYDFQFIIFTAEVGGSQVGPILNGDHVQVIDGYFTVYLDFGAGVFDGTALWLEVQVRDGGSMGAYTPLAPRQAVLPSPYSLYSGKVEWDDIEGMPPGFADGTDDGSQYQAGNQLDLVGDTFDVVEGAGSGLDADTVDGQEAADFATTTHGHAGEDITSGTVAVARIHSSVARDSEIMPTVLDADGAGSTLDADTVDGQQASDFASTTHGHAGEDITTGTVADGRVPLSIARVAEVMPIVLANDGPGSGLNADTLDGLGSGSFSPAAHSHFSAGNGLEYDGLILNVDPTDFNGSSPMNASSSGGGVFTAGQDVWVEIQSLTGTAPANGVILAVGSVGLTSWFYDPSPDIGFVEVGLGVNSADPVNWLARTFHSSADYGEMAVFEVVSVTKDEEYALRLKFRNVSDVGTYAAFKGRVVAVFIPN